MGRKKGPEDGDGGTKKPRRTERSGVDWKRGRNAYERDGKNFSEIAFMLQVGRDTVRSHALKEGWVNPAQILRESSADRAESIRLEFIERNRDAIVRSLSKKHEAASVLLDVVLLEANRLKEKTVTYCKQYGEQVVSEEPALVAARLTMALQRVTVIDRDIAGLKDDSWRSGSGANAADSEPDAAAVRAALEEATRGAADGSGEGAEGEVPN